MPPHARRRRLGCAVPVYFSPFNTSLSSARTTTRRATSICAVGAILPPVIAEICIIITAFTITCAAQASTSANAAGLCRCRSANTLIAVSNGRTTNAPSVIVAAAAVMVFRHSTLTLGHINTIRERSKSIPAVLCHYFIHVEVTIHIVINVSAKFAAGIYATAIAGSTEVVSLI